MALTPTAAWLAAAEQSPSAPRVLLEIYGTHTWKCLDYPCDQFTYDVALADVAGIAAELDPFTRAVQTSGLVVTVADAWIRTKLVAYHLKGKRVRVWLGWKEIAEADFLLIFTGVVDTITPQPGKQVVEIECLDTFGVLDLNEITGWWFNTFPLAACEDILTAGGLPADLLETASFDPAGIGDVIFTGAGLDDATSGGLFSGSGQATYLVEIDATGTPDTFTWTKDGAGGASGVAITGAAQTLSDGVTITFAATTGHTLGDQWEILATDANADISHWVVSRGPPWSVEGDGDMVVRSPTSSLGLANELAALVDGLLVPNEEGRVRMARFDSGGSAVDAWTMDDVTSMRQHALDENVANDVRIAFGSAGGGDLRYEVYRQDTDSIAAFAYPGESERIIMERFETPWLDGAWSRLLWGIPGSSGVCPVQFTGSGRNDCVSGGTYSGSGAAFYIVRIDSVSATPDTFQWSDDNGATWTTGVGITGAAQTLSDGVTVTFGHTDGHKLHDEWFIYANDDTTELWLSWGTHHAWTGFNVPSDWPTGSQESWAQPSADRPMYVQVGGEVMLVSSAITFNPSSMIGKTRMPINDDPADGVDRHTDWFPGLALLTVTRGRLGTSTTAHPAEVTALDITIPVSMATSRLKRFGKGAPVIEVTTPLHKAWLQYGDLVTLAHSDFVAYGKNGIGPASGNWEITCKEINAHASPPHIRWVLTWAAAPTPSMSWGLSHKYIERGTLSSMMRASSEDEDLTEAGALEGFAVEQDSGLDGIIDMGKLSNGITGLRSAELTHSFTASKDSYVDVNLTTHAITIFEVGNGVTPPPPPPGSVIIAKVVTNGSAITSVDQTMMPRRPAPVSKLKGAAFSCYRGTSVQSIASKSAIQVQFNASDFDNGTEGWGAAHYSTSGYYFTAPVDGIYRFSGRVRVESIPDGVYAYLALYSGGTLLKYGLKQYNTKGSADHLSLTLDTTVELSAADTVHLRVYQDDTSAHDLTYGTEQSYFCGEQIR